MVKKWTAHLMVFEEGAYPETKWVGYDLGSKSDKQDVIEAVKRDTRFWNKKVEVLDIMTPSTGKLLEKKLVKLAKKKLKKVI